VLAVGRAPFSPTPPRFCARNTRSAGASRSAVGQVTTTSSWDEVLGRKLGRLLICISCGVVALSPGRLTRLERGRIEEDTRAGDQHRLPQSILASDQKSALIKDMTPRSEVRDDRRTEITDQERPSFRRGPRPQGRCRRDPDHRGYVKRSRWRVRAAKARRVGLKGARPTASSEAPSGTRERTTRCTCLHAHPRLDAVLTQSGRACSSCAT